MPPLLKCCQLLKIDTGSSNTIPTTQGEIVQCVKLIKTLTCITTLIAHAIVLCDLRGTTPVIGYFLYYNISHISMFVLCRYISHLII